MVSATWLDWIYGDLLVCDLHTATSIPVII
jgi:hypothetical protein